MQLIAINDESEHGAKGHILEIASFKRDSKLHVWCHGVSGLPYSSSEVASLRHQWAEGNFGISPKNMSNYAIYNNEWDT
jgi:hypothetical protein